MDLYFDANAVINCMRLGCWGAVLRLPAYRPLIAENVVIEVRYPAQARLLRRSLARSALHQVQIVDAAELRIYAQLKARLGDGEAASLALAAVHGGCVASDEKGRFQREADRLLGPGRVICTTDLAVQALEAGTTTLTHLRLRILRRIGAARCAGKESEVAHLSRLSAEIEMRLGGREHSS